MSLAEVSSFESDYEPVDAGLANLSIHDVNIYLASSLARKNAQYSMIADDLRTLELKAHNVSRASSKQAGVIKKNSESRPRSKLSQQILMTRVAGGAIGALSLGVAVFTFLLFTFELNAGQALALPRYLAIFFVFSLLAASGIYLMIRLAPYSSNKNI